MSHFFGRHVGDLIEMRGHYDFHPSSLSRAVGLRKEQ
jgi:hypothetical protein